ncbi:hypothetical protein [Aquabacterium sp.]|uniref:hypothetical protein n=1 Tax=Aquabacterium sp. TaxID=1872578 RepID=UPI002C39F941|nr:hypothetical protein [Aquabacterium sp.]HSW08887.1 hypothetical protein [Aquabacterium sp.]
MLRTLFGELGLRRMPAPHDLDETAHVPLDAEGHTLPVAEAARRQTGQGTATDVVVDASPAAAMRAHFAATRADLDRAGAMITLLDPSRLWASQVIHALSDAANQQVERLALRERGTLRTLAVIERTLVPRRGTPPLKVYHADIRATGLEQEEIANALAEGSHMAAVIIGAMQPHAVVALLRSLLAATRQPEWRCPWLVFILPPGAATLRQRILDQDWPPHVRTAAMSESLAGASSVWNTVLTAWEAACAADGNAEGQPAAADGAPALQAAGVARALSLVARTEGLLACGLVNLACGDLLVTDARDDSGGSLATHAAAMCAARQAHLSASGAAALAPDELLVTAGTHQVLLRTVARAGELGLVALLDRSQANLALLRFRMLEAEKHLN